MYSPMHWAVRDNNMKGLETLLGFNADRNSTNKYNRTPLQMARSYDISEAVKLLTKPYSYTTKTYLEVPTLEEKMLLQLECKLQIDSLFKDRRGGRYNQVEVDARFDPIWDALYPNVKEALVLGDKDLLQRSVSPINSMCVLMYLLSSAVERDHLHLLDCLCDQIRIATGATFENTLFNSGEGGGGGGGVNSLNSSSCSSDSNCNSGSLVRTGPSILDKSLSSSYSILSSPLLLPLSSLPSLSLPASPASSRSPRSFNTYPNPFPTNTATATTMKPSSSSSFSSRSMQPVPLYDDDLATTHR